MASCSEFYAPLCDVMNSLLKFAGIEGNTAYYDVHIPQERGPEFRAAFQRVRQWMDAYKATEARFVAPAFVAACPQFDDPIYEEDLPEGTPPHPDYADIRMLLDQFRLGDVYTLDDEVIEAFRELGVLDEDRADSA